ncbi:autoinducer binding domain-containing protein [Candidatus Symbiopectobacterium endolongispinus]|nr:autoinducer binding domain-containing protein [Candidatus Symbiopectobacterium endolongispinus]
MLIFTVILKNRYIKDYLDQKIAKYGIIKYVYAIMNKVKNNKITLISNLPGKLIASYLNKNTQNIDPIIINALNRITSIFMG